VGWKAFFQHIDFPIQILAGLIRRSYLFEVMRILNMGGAFARARSNGFRHCESERKFKRFHGYYNSVQTEKFTSLVNKWLIFRGVVNHGY
jgi:hypothetical protein